MGLTLAERRAVTEATAVRYSLAGKRTKSIILDELCATTGWHRNHARKALTTALQPKLLSPRSPRPLKYGPDVGVDVGGHHHRVIGALQVLKTWERVVEHNFDPRCLH